MPEKKVLIVDYDKKSLDLMAQIFKPYKLHILQANDGVSALETFRAENPDLVILEAILPKLHGFDLTKTIFQETKGRVPVIIVTGLYRGPQYRHEALTSLGAADYFEKPFDKAKLLNSVMNLLNENVEIEDELPDPETVIRNLEKKIERQH